MEYELTVIVRAKHDGRSYGVRLEEKVESRTSNTGNYTVEDEDRLTSMGRFLVARAAQGLTTYVEDQLGFKETLPTP